MKRLIKKRIREVSAMLLAVVLGLLFWLAPGFQPWERMSGQEITSFMVAIFVMLLIYLTLQGLPIARTNIGTPIDQNLDAIASTIPGGVSMFGVLASLFGFWPLSLFWMMIGMLVILVVLFDLFILGGIAAKILLLTDDVKIQKE